jgi:hypothetical protein
MELVCGPKGYTNLVDDIVPVNALRGIDYILMLYCS